ncbi:hypothetical protein [Acidicapsa acidisoli]|uniref:hypothetical protein n=1 Tax=Acidicapsa acidisoli TaxID=1615681 RepID=UPI0021E052A7|nr:hypothetical protein [Acidicapsa acidisoli]
MRTAERLLQSFRSENDAANHSPQVQKLLTEWEQDRVMARERNETGKEPENRPLELRNTTSRSAKRKQPKKEQSKGVDIPF